MRADEIRAHVRRHPFQPIRVFVSDGSFYDVLHHDFMLVGRTEVIIGLSSSPDEFPDKKAYLDPVHITRIEPINGKRVRTRRRRK
ncbi:MAG: hypothetical protein AABZ12_06480 [Planctomycetota bacterium]